MDIRTHESPMDFEWQTHGPADESSPFHKLAMSHRQSQMDNQAKKRTHSIFESPSKSPNPSLREPLSQTFLFSQTPSSKPASAFRNPSFTTPRMFDTDMFSSGPENPSSPENADGEDTPEPPSWNAVGKMSTAMTQFVGEQVGKQQPLLGNYGKFGGISPGRGKVPRGKYSDAITKKVHKRRRREAEKDYRLASRRPSEEESESDGQGSRPSSSEGPNNRNNINNAQPLDFLPRMLYLIETHPNLPHILSFYAQLILNFFLVFVFMYLVYSFWATIRSDVDKKSEEVAAETLAEMAMCAQSYVENRCDRSSRVPAMEIVCNNWEKCMNKDPSSVGRARVSAHTFAEIFNSFIEPISYKAMVRAPIQPHYPYHLSQTPPIQPSLSSSSLNANPLLSCQQIFSLFLMFGIVATSNFAFGLFRNKHHPPPPPPPFAYPQQQQQRYPSGGITHEQYYNTPYQTPMIGQEQGPSVGALEWKTPARKGRYR
ncbi:MAG: hypothetical protein M1827_005938 [Pycnora praestabilis]|nr:MAG: hypothetical protein M1827_005938 [Pycnora praestabilis]